MSRRFAVFDIDGTIIRWQLIHATFDALARAGSIKPEDFASVRTARLHWKTRQRENGFMAYQQELIQLIEKTTKGLGVEDFEAATRAAFDEYKDQVYVYTRELIRNLKTDGYLLFAVSGSHREMVHLLADYYGFDDSLATVYERDGEVLSGVIHPITGGKDKLVRQLMAKHGATLTGSIAVGDSEGDIEMLDMVEQPIAFNPSKGLFRHAEAHGWREVVERKSMIYELAPDAPGKPYSLVRTNA